MFKHHLPEIPTEINCIIIWIICKFYIHLNIYWKLAFVYNALIRQFSLPASAQKPEEVIRRYVEVVAAVPDEVQFNMADSQGLFFYNYDTRVTPFSCLFHQDCIICMDQLSNPSGYDTVSTEDGGQSILPDTVGKFIKCGHTLHMLCMLAMYNNGTKVL